MPPVRADKYSRQITLVGLRKVPRQPGRFPAWGEGVQYDDVRDAWNYYLKNDNKGRGVVLVGHSQGSFILIDLIKHEIDGQPIQSKLVSAILMGTVVPVPKGKDVGGAFQKIPLCHSASQLGCLITFASFRSNMPPPANTLFGKVPDPNMVAACVELRPRSSRRQRRSARVSRHHRPHDYDRDEGEAVGDAGAADRHAVGQRAGAADGESARRTTTPPAISR